MCRLCFTVSPCVCRFWLNTNCLFLFVFRSMFVVLYLPFFSLQFLHRKQNKNKNGGEVKSLEAAVHRSLLEFGCGITQNMNRSINLCIQRSFSLHFSFFSGENNRDFLSFYFYFYIFLIIVFLFLVSYTMEDLISSPWLCCLKFNLDASDCWLIVIDLLIISITSTVAICHCRCMMRIFSEVHWIPLLTEPLLLRLPLFQFVVILCAQNVFNININNIKQNSVFSVASFLWNVFCFNWSLAQWLELLLLLCNSGCGINRST